MAFSEYALIPVLQELVTSSCETTGVKLPKRGKLNHPASTSIVFWVAYSGGVDSHVLLFAIAKLLSSAQFDAQLVGASSIQLRAIHINHNLSPNSAVWQIHCEGVCAALEVPLSVRQVHLNNLPDGKQSAAGSLETRAREMRYQAFHEILTENDYLLMAHHQDDQLETILFRLLRGAGPRGLSAIPAKRRLDKAMLLRPLLQFSREELVTFADANQLNWIEDESNQDRCYDRNFLRHEILPLLKQRWPGLSGNWQRAAQLCGEAEQLQILLGKEDLKLVQTDHPNKICIDALKQFELIRQRNVLRVWFLKLQSEFSLPLPTYGNIERVLLEVLAALPDSSPLVSWSSSRQKIEVRRFAGHLYALKPLGIIEGDDSSLIWKAGQSLTLPGALGSLSSKAVSKNGINLSGIEQLKVKFRQGGEQAKPANRRTRPLKKIFQDYQVPPWLRDHVPLIYIDDELVAVAGLFICDGWQSESGENLQCFYWNKVDIYCGF